MKVAQDIPCVRQTTVAIKQSHKSATNTLSKKTANKVPGISIATVTIKESSTPATDTASMKVVDNSSRLLATDLSGLNSRMLEYLSGLSICILECLSG